MSTLTLYTYANCDTCRRAVKWLNAHGIAFDEKPIRETPPSAAELRTMLQRLGGRVALRKLFNTSGVEYRKLKVGELLPTLSDAEALSLLAGNGSLVKRPFVIGSGDATGATGALAGVGLVGFDEPTWSGVFAGCVRK
jgi:arsenate reductase